MQRTLPAKSRHAIQIEHLGSLLDELGLGLSLTVFSLAGEETKPVKGSSGTHPKPWAESVLVRRLLERPPCSLSLPFLFLHPATLVWPAQPQRDEMGVKTECLLLLSTGRPQRVANPVQVLPSSLNIPDEATEAQRTPSSPGPPGWRAGVRN